MQQRAVVLGLVVAALGTRADAQDTIRVSVDSSGNEGSDRSGETGAEVIGSGAKTVVFFDSTADDLVSGDQNGERDVFEHSVGSGTTVRIVMGSGGVEPNDWSSAPIPTPDGRYVLFASAATNLVASDTNGHSDAFVLDRSTGKIELVSVASDGSQGDDWSRGTSISDDGRYVAFMSMAGNFTKGDTNASFDVFLHDRKAKTTECVSVTPKGVPGNDWSLDGTLSADGLLVAFESSADDLVTKDVNTRRDVFVRDLSTATTTLVSVDPKGGQLDGDSVDAQISPDGEWIVFASLATDAIPGGTQFGVMHVYVGSLLTGDLYLASAASDGVHADGSSGKPRIALFQSEPIAFFHSDATNLVPGDTNGTYDLFASRVLRQTIQRVDVASDGAETHPGVIYDWGFGPSPDGTQVAFASDAADLVSGDGNGEGDVFVRGLLWTFFTEFGDGLPGSGGFEPRLFGRGGSCEEGGCSVHVEDGLGGAFGHLWIGTQVGVLPIFGGYLYIDLAAPFVVLPIALGGASGAAGAGTLDLDGANLEDFGAAEVYLQCTFLDAGAKRRVSISNLLVFDFGK